MGDASDLEVSRAELPNLSCKVESDDYIINQDYSDKGVSFWKAYKLWLAERGFALYKIEIKQTTAIPRWFPPTVTTSAPLPFAIRLENSYESPPGQTIGNKYALAQDSVGRDVFIKLVMKTTAEYHINRSLLETYESSNTATFPCMLMPVAMLDSPHDFAFMVTPLWSVCPDPGKFDTVGQVLLYIKCLLTALSFLHKYRIAHRDISNHNVLINGYCPELSADDNSVVKEHLHSANVTFCLFDYDLSIQLPRDTPLDTCRRPREEVYRGSPIFHPRDCELGPVDYNPFAFDVGCLGMMFLYHFTSAIPTIPLIAPLCASMTTHIVAQRFTAAQALSFFDTHAKLIPEEQLGAKVTLEPSFEPMRNPEMYWALLSSKDREIFKNYQVLPRPWWHRLLRPIATTSFGWRFIVFVRRTFGI